MKNQATERPIKKHSTSKTEVDFTNFWYQKYIEYSSEPENERELVEFCLEEGTLSKEEIFCISDLYDYSEIKRVIINDTYFGDLFWHPAKEIDLCLIKHIYEIRCGQQFNGKSFDDIYHDMIKRNWGIDDLSTCDYSKLVTPGEKCNSLAEFSYIIEFDAVSAFFEYIEDLIKISDTFPDILDKENEIITNTQNARMKNKLIDDVITVYIFTVGMIVDKIRRLNILRNNIGRILHKAYTLETLK